MKTLKQAINRKGTGVELSLMKRLEDSGISEWSDLTRSRLEEFKDILSEEVALSSEKTYLAVLKATMARYADEVDIPCKEFRDILKCRNDKPMKTYLTLEELEQLEKVAVKTQVERHVLDEFLIGAYTGMRISDTKETSTENIQDGVLRYVSIKTGVHATVPLKRGLEERIERARGNRVSVSLVAYNEAIRRLCRRAGINSMVKVRKGGKDLTGEKWEFVSSHTARISFCSNLSRMGASLVDIARMAGHTSTIMTERYIATRDIKLPETAMAFFN